MIRYLRFRVFGQSIIDIMPELLEWQKDDVIERKKGLDNPKITYRFEAVHPGGIIAEGTSYNQTGHFELYPHQRLKNKSLKERREFEAARKLLNARRQESQRLKDLAQQFNEPLRRELFLAQQKGKR